MLPSLSRWFNCCKFCREKDALLRKQEEELDFYRSKAVALDTLLESLRATRPYVESNHPSPVVEALLDKVQEVRRLKERLGEV